jgi:hypothetical protein
LNCPSGLPLCPGIHRPARSLPLGVSFMTALSPDESRCLQTAMRSPISSAY